MLIAAVQIRRYVRNRRRAYPARGALQLVFCDLGTPGDGWNVYDELRTHLAARGVPADAVRFIHEARTDRDKARLFAACRSGSVAVLVGSTEKMGVGTNVQDRAIALHHLDAPWRPADVAQREGRIVRQGNLNAEVQIYRWVTEGSFDGYMWQTLERKAAFISQVMRGRLDAREINDIGETTLSFSEVKALATGNPLLMDKAEADADLARLQRSERAHARNQNALTHSITRHEDNITKLTALVGDIEAAISRRQDTRGDKFAMTVDGRAHGKRVAAGQHLKHLLQRQMAELDGLRVSTATHGQVGGFPVTAAAGRALGKTVVTLSLDGAPRSDIHLSEQDVNEADPAGLVTRLENRLARLEEEKASTWPTSAEPTARSRTPRTASASRSRRPASSPPPASAPARSTKNSARWPHPRRPVIRPARSPPPSRCPPGRPAQRPARRARHRPLPAQIQPRIRKAAR